MNIEEIKKYLDKKRITNCEYDEKLYVFCDVEMTYENVIGIVNEETIGDKKELIWRATWFKDGYTHYDSGNSERIIEFLAEIISLGLSSKKEKIKDERKKLIMEL